ncbi:GNAT family N-acetyltransferase [Mesobacillus subterraneus]|uniref:GNAT family N-acetyltransferase n=1 Tax=Mesobacillus subterraneus TaxID=285983 RepID=UPI001CFD159D|nr:GNAT family N-acetyltransferase [Mesobacillus subterraneus]WLR54722.1 GNAT family N-acetyltransferase [Mesobacillus subterraneus]
MQKIHKPWIKLKENIDDEDYKVINELQDRCLQTDQIALKLELDYKVGVRGDSSKGVQDINEYLYFDGELLIGYIGICSFGGPLEVNGMVHPEYRCQGVFTKLFELVIAEWRRRSSGSLLLLSDRNSESGQQFIATTGAQYKHSEYEMYLKKDVPVTTTDQLTGIVFRKAANADAKEIARQNAIYFNDEEEVNADDMPLPEVEEKRGMTSYLVEKEGVIIGKVNLQLTSKLGAIFGLGVLPEHRRKGYGRALLLLAIKKLKEANAQEIMLQVASENSNALDLYKSCGFEETSTMDYFELRS